MNSIFIKLFWFFYLFFIIKFSTIHAQKCSLQVFSEFDNYDLFIDNNFIGSNITKLDSIECGDHYIKISYQDIIIFSEIITFNSTSTKKILIKRTKEIEDKILSSKSKEISEYKRKKLSIGLNKKYITTSNIQMDQYSFKPLFNNYYGLQYSGQISGIQFSESEEKITDWFFIEGGYVKMNDFEFLKNYCDLTKDCKQYEQAKILINDIYKKNEKVMKKNKKISKWQVFFAIMMVFGLLFFIWGLIELLVPLFLDAIMALNFFIGGLIVSLIALVLGSVLKNKPLKEVPEKFLTLKGALKMIDDYNSALKKQLNLPENID